LVRPAPNAPTEPAATLLRQRAYEAASRVVDPEIPVLTIADLGVLRGVDLVDGVIEVTITPTYSGCPAMGVIAIEIQTALIGVGITDARIATVLAPAWTTDWLTAEGRTKLTAYGIAPPSGKASRRALFSEDERVACPQCGSDETEPLAEFGSTACKALWRCRHCAEPFDYFKCH
jgi:ring-1,2-phenylacetyl-CoA epoxidase subunit PaaD